MKLKNGQITINQANEESKYPPVPWGDEPWLPGTLVQPSMAQEKHEQGLEQGKVAMESQQKETEYSFSDSGAEEEVRALVNRSKWLTQEIARRLAS